MTTEAELVLMGLTVEELDDASRWVGYIDAHWKAITADERRQGGLPTDGPWHLMTAMRLAIIREQVARGGADEWFAGMPTEGHPAGRILEHYGRRLQLNAIPGLAPRLSRAGVLEQQCVICGVRKPLAAVSFPRPDGVWGNTCHDCLRPRPELIAAALEPAPAPAEPAAAIEDEIEEWSAL